MRFYIKIVFLFLSLLLIVPVTMAQNANEGISSKKEKKKKKSKYKLPDIDLSHWKVTIPAGDPAEVAPPEILDYANNETLKNFMYNDSVRGALVFYAVPNATTANTKYSRSELREQMEPGSNKVNWTFKQGGTMKGRLAMGNVSKDKDGKYHKVIIMQIHGRLTNEQRDLIGQKDNNAPPILKIYWQNGKIRVKTKQLKDLSMSETDILRTDSWTDDKGHTFKEKVDFRPFDLEVKVSEGKLVVSLNKTEYAVYDDIHMEKWGVFENYFKAGNYLQTRDEGAHAEVKYFSLEVSH
jgi:hypothetical protein